MKVSEMNVISADDKYLTFMKTMLKKSLYETKDSDTLLDVSKFRQIGKTTALMEFAKEINCAVVVKNPSIAFTFRKKYSCSCIFSVQELIGKSIKEAVVDEGVDITILNQMGIKIIGGYYTPKKETFDMSNEMFLQNIVTKLKLNAYSLCKSMDAALTKAEFTTYKNLAHSLTDVMFLINEYDKKKCTCKVQKYKLKK